MHALDTDFAGSGIDVGLLDEMQDSLRALAAHCGTLHGGSHEDDPLPDAGSASRRSPDTAHRREDVVELNRFHRRVLEVACELYARPEEWTSDGNAMKYPLMRLDEVVLRLIWRERYGAS